MIDKELQKKIDQSIKLLKVACKGKMVELAYSGGKDSDVILQLAKEAEIDFVPIHKVTTIDPPGTIKHAIDNGCEIRRPQKNILSACPRERHTNEICTLLLRLSKGV